MLHPINLSQAISHSSQRREGEPIVVIRRGPYEPIDKTWKADVKARESIEGRKAGEDA